MIKLNDELTERELDILKLMAKGYSQRDIASCIFYSISSVGRFGRNIAQKLCCISGKLNIIRTALILGILTIDDLKEDNA